MIKFKKFYRYIIVFIKKKLKTRMLMEFFSHMSNVLLGAISIYYTN